MKEEDAGRKKVFKGRCIIRKKNKVDIKKVRVES